MARVRAAHQHNPNEEAAAVAVRDGIGIQPRYPVEADSTIIYRQVDADLLEEVVSEQVTDEGEVRQLPKKEMRAPQTLPAAGSEVFRADAGEIADAIGLAHGPEKGLHLGDRLGSTDMPVYLKREAVQRHMFVCGTTGSGKSYAIGVLAEELNRHGLPIVFLDTQNEFGGVAESLGGRVAVPGEDFTIRVSSLEEEELVALLPVLKTVPVQRDAVGKAFMQLKSDLLKGQIDKFTIDDLTGRIRSFGPPEFKAASVNQAADRVARLKYNKVFGEGKPRTHWGKWMTPAVAVQCKSLTSGELRTVATALLRELQDLRLRHPEHVPPYAMVIDEAHLFVPEGVGTACKQIIREGVRIGRHHGICMILSTQSPADIDRSTIRQCNTRMVFALEPDQLDAIRGVKADATDEMLRALPKMPRGNCLLSGTYESVRHAVPMHVRERKRETPEGGAAPDIFKLAADFKATHAPAAGGGKG